MADRIYRVLNLVDDLSEFLVPLHGLPQSAGIIDRLWYVAKVIMAYALYVIWIGFVMIIAFSVLSGMWTGIPVAVETFLSFF